jgi:putative ABC transport system permease protein
MSYVEIPWVRLALAGLLIVLAIVLSRIQRLGLEFDLAVGAIRAAVQLVAIGFVLVLIFHTESAALTILALTVMLSVAAVTAARRVRHGPGWRVLFPRALVAIGAAFLVALLPVLAWVIPVLPILTPQYAIPIGGMVLASGMNVVALVFERIFDNARQRAPQIEQALALGASPTQALAPLQRAAVRAAMLPSMNALLTLGLVQLPGMMTGQILSGTAPTEAVRYQIVIMYQLVAVAAVSGALAARLARHALFDEEERLRRWPTPARNR